MRDLFKFLIPFFILYILIRFFRFIFVFIFKFWFISIPVIIILYLYFKRRYHIKKEFSNLDPDKEIKVYPEPTVEDDE